MKIFYMSKEVKGLILDIDNTLYRNQEYIQSQIRVLTQRFADHFGITYGEGEKRIESYKADFAQKNKGKKPSVGNTFLSFGISIETSVLWRNELIQPESYLLEDSRLQKTLDRLSESFTLRAVTNNPKEIGKRTLKTLGVEHVIAHVIGLDTTGVSKPNTIPFELAIRETGIPAENWVSIGDRYEVDLEVPLAMGMGAVLVESMEDVYELPAVLENRT
jgi:FMN phosphatase YigB (HAD superfamily)